MDMRQYASTYVKPDNVRDGPIQTRIINVFESERHGRPVLELETGSQFTLNDGNVNTLIKAWGYKSDDWIGQELVLELGTYKDWRADPPVDKETVRVRAISPAKTAAGNSGEQSKPPLPPSRTVAAKKDDMDDAIHFEELSNDNGMLPCSILRPSENDLPSAFACLAPPSERMHAP
jgi:hypothetical protein